MTNNPTIGGVSRELLKKQFEEKNEHRGWFVAGGSSESDTPEGFVYSDFTTDMCWTCYFEANAALQSTIAQLQARIAELESGRGEPIGWIDEPYAEWLKDKTSGWATVWGTDGTGNPSRRKPSVAVFTAPPAPVAVVLPSSQELHVLICKAARQADLTPGANYFTAAEFAAIAVLDATAALNEGRK